MAVRMQSCFNMKRIAFLMASAISLNSFAGHLAAKCVMEENSSVITGHNVDQRLPIASVSKLFTSLFAVATKGVDSRFITTFYISPVGSDTFDVHLEGSLDPYFSEQSLHYLISQLNKMNVFKIRNLTFDENFKFYFNTNGRQIIPGVHGVFNPVDSQRRLTDPSPELVKKILANKKQWLQNYNKTLAKYPDDLVKKPKLAVHSIEYMPSSKFTSPLKPSGYVRSADLVTQLKMMNWNSNNHAANMIFESLGAKPKFDKFFTERLKFKPSEFEFYNGSGNNDTFDGGEGTYNSASCSAVIRTVKALNHSLAGQKHNLEDIVAVVGADRGATVQRYAVNVGINDGVVAKSGTIQSNVVLAGMINTKKGKYFFAFNYATAGLPRMKKPSASRIASAMRAEWSRTRGQVGAELSKLVKSLGGAESLGYQARPFDLESFEGDDTETVSDGDIKLEMQAAGDSDLTQSLE